MGVLGGGGWRLVIVIHKKRNKPVRTSKQQPHIATRAPETSWLADASGSFLSLSLCLPVPGGAGGDGDVGEVAGGFATRSDCRLLRRWPEQQNNHPPTPFFHTLARKRACVLFARASLRSIQGCTHLYRPPPHSATWMLVTFPYIDGVLCSGRCGVWCCTCQLASTGQRQRFASGAPRGDRDGLMWSLRSVQDFEDNSCAVFLAVQHPNDQPTHHHPPLGFTVFESLRE